MIEFCNQNKKKIKRKILDKNFSEETKETELYLTQGQGNPR